MTSTPSVFVTERSEPAGGIVSEAVALLFPRTGAANPPVTEAEAGVAACRGVVREIGVAGGRAEGRRVANGAGGGGGNVRPQGDGARRGRRGRPGRGDFAGARGRRAGRARRGRRRPRVRGDRRRH